jgi:hypothetical protein
MAEDVKGLLLDDRWAPVTSEMGFLETRAEHAVRAFASWQEALMAPRGISVEVQPVSGSLEQVLSSLLPVTSPERQRHLFVPTRGTWTAYLDNGWGGTDAASAMGAMARRVGCRSLRVVGVPNTYREGQGRYGAVMLEMYGPQLNARHNNTVRALAAANDGGRWVFHQSGEPFPFEKLEQYEERKVRDRFTFEMLKDYLHHLGLSPFEEDFYLPDGAPAWLVRKTGAFTSKQGGYTLEQVRAEVL